MKLLLLWLQSRLPALQPGREAKQAGSVLDKWAPVLLPIPLSPQCPVPSRSALGTDAHSSPRDKDPRELCP